MLHCNVWAIQQNVCSVIRKLCNIVPHPRSSQRVNPEDICLFLAAPEDFSPIYRSFNLPHPAIMAPLNDNVVITDVPVLATTEKSSDDFTKEEAVLDDLGPAPDGSAESYEDPKAARRLLTKCDIRLIPILGCLYLVSFLDRSNIANARLFGLEKSLHMPSTGFNTCLWIFYLPFVIVEIPSNLFMSLNKIKPNQWLAGAMLILGIF